MVDKEIQEEPQTNPPENEEIDLLDYLVVLAKHSRMIVFSSLIISVLTLGLLLLMPNMYTATARLFPPQQNTSLTGQLINFLGVSQNPATGGSGLGGMAASMLGLKSPGDLYVGILTGNTVYDNIIKRFNLRELYDTEFIEDTRKMLEKRSEITADKDGLISIDVTDEDPKRASEMANAFLEEMDRLLQRISQQEAAGYLVFLEKERDTSLRNLTKAEDGLRTFSEQTKVLQIDAQTKGMLEYIASLRATIDAKEVQVKVYQQQATAYNYDIIRLDTEIKGLKDKLRTAEASIDPNCVGDVCIPTDKVPALGLEYFRLVREVKYQEALYQLYAKLAEMAHLDVVRSVSVIDVVDYAIPPERKSKPRRLLITAGVGVFAFFVMIFVAFFLEYYRKIKTHPEDVQRLATIQIYLAPFTRPFTKCINFFRRWKGSRRV